MTALRLFFRMSWIGICALSMLAQTRLLLGFSLVPGWLDGFVLGGAVFAYNFTHRDRLHQTAAWLAGIGGGVCFFIPLLKVPSITTWQTGVLFPAILWLLYYGLQRPGNAGLRGVPAAKPFVVALAWAWVTVLLPVLPDEWSRVAVVFFGRAAFIFALALAYDLADLAYDRRHGLTTLAAQLGVRTTFVLISGALTVAALCCLANVALDIYDWRLAVPLLLSLALSAWWLWFLFQKTAWSGWHKVLIDALMVGQFLMVWAGAMMKI